jgi:hypothetical protein
MESIDVSQGLQHKTWLPTLLLYDSVYAKLTVLL